MSEAPSTPRPLQNGLYAWSEGAPVPAALLGSLCPSCAKKAFPRRPQCPACGAAMQDQPLTGAGTIYSSTTVRVPSPVGLKPPYAYGLVDLDQGPRIHALFTGAAVENFVPGSRVELVFEGVRPGGDIVAHKFRPRAAGAAS